MDKDTRALVMTGLIMASAVVVSILVSAAQGRAATTEGIILSLVGFAIYKLYQIEGRLNA